MSPQVGVADEKMRDIFETIRQLVASLPEKKRRITGFSRT